MPHPTPPAALPRALLLALALTGAGCAGPNPTLPDGGQDDFTLAGDTLGCLPDNDGAIQASELPFAPGLTAAYRANPPGTLVGLDPAGRQVEGKLEWDFSSTAGNIYPVTTEPLAGKWFAGHFPTGDLATGVTVSGDLYQVLQLQPDRVLLLGLASRTPDTQPGYTLIVYDPPVVAMRYPLQQGLRFTSTGTTRAGATLKGLAVHMVDTYEVAIRTEGVVRLPNLRLHRALLVETTVTSKTVGGVSAVTRQLQWFAECYGEVVRAISQTNEPQALFTTASELRRLSF